jgi:PPP family 3-phenylpropionic acid transporter
VNEATRYRLIYLAYFAALSGFGTFRNAFLEDIGMTGFRMGVIGATITVAATAAQPFWGLVTDWKGAQREVLVVAAAVTAVAVLTYPVAPLFDPTFVILLAGTLLYSVFYAPISPITDSLVLSTGVAYGRVRAYGSIAFGLGSLCYGVLIARLGSGVIFYVYSLGMAALVVAAWGVPSRDANSVGVVGRDAVELITDRDFLLLLASASLVGFTLLSGNDFFSVYIREINGTDTTTGVAWFVLTVVEAAAFVYLFRLTSRYRYLLALGGFAYAAKYAVYYTVESPALVVASHLVTGVSFAAFYLAAVSLADTIAPDSLSSTAQTLVWSATFGVGAGVGQIAAGSLVDSAGVASMYGFLAAVAASGGAVALFISTDYGDSGETEGQTREPLPSR